MAPLRTNEAVTSESLMTLSYFPVGLSDLRFKPLRAWERVVAQYRVRGHVSKMRDSARFRRATPNS